MSMDDDAFRPTGKRDRLARMLRVVTVLRGHPDGIRPSEIARRVNVATRTVYRDLRALEEEVGVAVWSEGGLWGVVGEEFLPALKLTLDEAMAVVLSARLMVRYVDKYDPDLAAAFEKLEEVLPRPLAEHVERTLDVLAQHPRDAAFSEHVHRLTRAWAERRVVSLDYEPARYAPESAARRAIVHPYLIEPSLQTHALYLIGWDETRGAVRTFKIERIRDVSVTPRTFDPPEPGLLEKDLRRAWTSSPTRPRLTSSCASTQPWPVASRRRPGIRPSGWNPRRMARSSSAPRWPDRSRSASGSCHGVTPWRSWSRPTCAPTWPPRFAERWTDTQIDGASWHARGGPFRTIRGRVPRHRRGPQTRRGCPCPPRQAPGAARCPPSAVPSS